MGVTWQRFPSDDIVINERPARRAPTRVEQELTERFARPVIEWNGLVVNHQITDIERYARVMRWDED